MCTQQVFVHLMCFWRAYFLFFLCSLCGSWSVFLNPDNFGHVCLSQTHNQVSLSAQDSVGLYFFFFICSSVLFQRGLWQHFFSAASTNLNQTQWKSQSKWHFNILPPWNKILFNTNAKAAWLKLNPHFPDSAAHNCLCLITKVTLNSSPKHFPFSVILSPRKCVTY